MSSRPKTHVHIDKLGESTMPERSFSSVDFIKGLEQFSHYKYSWTDEPFDYLFQFVGQKSPLYEQFSSLLIWLAYQNEQLKKSFAATTHSL